MRKVFFWLHLTAGTVAGIVILMMSVTGALLMYERQMIAWADRSYRSTPAAGQPRMQPEGLIAKLTEAGQRPPVSLVLQADATAPAEATYGRTRTVFLDVYSGTVLGEGSQTIRSFFRVVTDWHRWLAMEGEGRAFGRAITGACNLAFLFLVVSGMYLWLPRKWGTQQVRAVLLFRGGLSGKARDFNWHNVIGIWSAVPLFVVVLGGVVISYPWATNLLYRITGSEPPAVAQVPPGGRTGAPGAPPQGRSEGGRPASAPNFDGLDTAWAQAEQKVPGWSSITLRLTAGRGPYAFAVAESHRGRPDLRSTVTVDRRTAEVTGHETFSSFNTGRRVRSWLRFLHTGEALGLAGQTVAGVVSAGGAVLVWTGIALSWRRFRSWRARGKANQNPSVLSTTLSSGSPLANRLRFSTTSERMRELSRSDPPEV